MSGRSIFDITDQNFGRLDETIKVANDNDFSLNDEVTEDLTIGDYEGDVKKKDAIALQGFTFNNDFEGVVPDPIIGLLDFDGVDDYVQLDSLPDISQDQIIKFKMYLKAESGFDSGIEGTALINLRDDINDDAFYIGLKNSDFYVTVENTSTDQHLSPLSGISNQIIEVEIRKFFNVFWRVDYVKFNDVIIPTTGANLFSGGGSFRIGRGISPSSFTENALIWDVRLYNSSNVLINNWLCQPAGNLDPAWEDQVGAIDGTVFGSPTTIDIP